jgi:hypothetical protein
MKFRYVSKFDNWHHDQYYMGRKKGAIVKIYQKEGNRYYFLINREKDDFRFNSSWGQHPDQDQQERLASLPDMRFETLEDALGVIAQWVDDHVPTLIK